jgi:hypothetical protein
MPTTVTLQHIIQHRQPNHETERYAAIWEDSRVTGFVHRSDLHGWVDAGGDRWYAPKAEQALAVLDKLRVGYPKYQFRVLSRHVTTIEEILAYSYFPEGPRTSPAKPEPEPYVDLTPGEETMLRCIAKAEGSPAAFLEAGPLSVLQAHGYVQPCSSAGPYYYEASRKGLDWLQKMGKWAVLSSNRTHADGTRTEQRPTERDEALRKEILALTAAGAAWWEAINQSRGDQASVAASDVDSRLSEDEFSALDEIRMGAAPYEHLVAKLQRLGLVVREDMGPARLTSAGIEALRARNEGAAG